MTTKVRYVITEVQRNEAAMERGESTSRLAHAGDQFARVALEPARSGSAVQRRLERGARFFTC